MIIQSFFFFFPQVILFEKNTREGTSFSQVFSCGLCTGNQSCLLLWEHSSKWELHSQAVSYSFPPPPCQIFLFFPFTSLLPTPLPTHSSLFFFPSLTSQQQCRLLSGNFPLRSSLLSVLLNSHFTFLVRNNTHTIGRQKWDGLQRTDSRTASSLSAAEAEHFL